MAGCNMAQNRMTAIRAIISALALLVVFCGMAAGDSVFVWNGSYSENVVMDEPRLTLVSSIIEFVPA